MISTVVSCRCASWRSRNARGIVFVGLTPGATLDLDSWLGDLEPLLAGLGLADLHHFSTRELPGTNYKIILDGFLETYHFAALHATSVALTNVSNMVAFDSWGPHQRNASALRGIAEEARKTEGDRDPAMAVAPNYWLFPGMAIAGCLSTSHGYIDRHTGPFARRVDDAADPGPAASAGR